RLMTIGLAATALFSLRHLEGSGYRFWPAAGDWKTGIRWGSAFLPVGILLGAATGFGHYRATPVEPWIYPALAAGMFAGMYAAVALFEELVFRGVMQNLLGVTLRQPRLAQFLASIAYGAAHLPFRGFPNWRFALLAAIAGWFYGEAYRERTSVVP